MRVSLFNSKPIAVATVWSSVMVTSGAVAVAANTLLTTVGLATGAALPSTCNVTVSPLYAVLPPCSAPETLMTAPVTGAVLAEESTRRATRSGLALGSVLLLEATKRTRSLGARKTALLSARSAARVTQVLVPAFWYWYTPLAVTSAVVPAEVMVTPRKVLPASTSVKVPPKSSVTVLLAVMALLLGPACTLGGPYHLLGTDLTGNDVFYQALKSIRTAFVIGTLSTIATLPLAVGLGLMAGYFKGWVDEAIQYLYTVLSSVPNVLLIAACVLMVQVFLDKNPDLFETGAERADLKLFLLCAILGLTGAVAAGLLFQLLEDDLAEHLVFLHGTDTQGMHRRTIRAFLPALVRHRLDAVGKFVDTHLHHLGQLVHQQVLASEESVGIGADDARPPLVHLRVTAWKLALREMEWFLSASSNVFDLRFVPDRKSVV